MITLVVNNEIIKKDIHPATPVVDFLRDELDLKGTKIGCREGDCGACTVLVGELVGDRVVYKSTTSCLMPLGNVAYKHLVTIEGLNIHDLTPIQQAFVDENGTQCGFCTPGFIVSLVGFCMDEREKTVENALKSISGNICRCTGYKSIERSLQIIVNKLKKIDEENRIAWLVQNSFLPKYFLHISKKIKEVSKNANVEVADAKYIMGGGTDLMLQDLDEVIDASVRFVSTDPAFKGIEFKDGKCFIGSATTTSELYESSEFLKIFPGIKSYLKLISSEQIRNMATVAGNLVNGSPIGDLAIIFQALRAKLIISKNGKTREQNLDDFFKGYRKVNIEKGELVEKVVFDLPGENIFFSFEKISKRVHLDMATVNSAMKISMSGDKIVEASFSVGGLGATIRNMEKTIEFLKGKVITDETFIEANKTAQSEITPRSRAEYKRLLVRQQLFCHLKSVKGNKLTLEALR